MPSKRLSSRRRHYRPVPFHLPTLFLSVALAVAEAGAQAVTNGPSASAPFVGAPSCGSSSCHGGAGENRNQLLVWSRQDFHSRAFDTLTRRRSVQIAEALRIDKPAASSRCTTCHAPFHDVPAALRAADVLPNAGVSCESCHGPAASWLRSHTRPDWSHADRAAAGLRELRDLYHRANACVACHQNVPFDLLEAGHPSLLFELDGQAAAQPRHWRERDEAHGPKSWLVGQAVALREASWQLEQEKTADEAALARWRGLLWLVQQAAQADARWTSLAPVADQPAPENWKLARALGDQLARQIAAFDWSPALTRACLEKLSATHADFADAKVSRPVHARRAERLVLALDRLFLALGGNAWSAGADADLNSLYKSVQSLPDFDPAAFARSLAAFDKRIRAAAVK